MFLSNLETFFEILLRNTKEQKQWVKWNSLFINYLIFKQQNMPWQIVSIYACKYKADTLSGCSQGSYFFPIGIMVFWQRLWLVLIILCFYFVPLMVVIWQCWWWHFVSDGHGHLTVLVILKLRFWWSFNSVGDILFFPVMVVIWQWSAMVLSLYFWWSFNSGLCTMHGPFVCFCNGPLTVVAGCSFV